MMQQTYKPPSRLLGLPLLPIEAIYSQFGKVTVVYLRKNLKTVSPFVPDPLPCYPTCFSGLLGILSSDERLCGCQFGAQAEQFTSFKC